MIRCSGKTFAHGSIEVECELEDGHHAEHEGCGERWSEAGQPRGIVAELVHYVRPFALPDGTNEEVPAIVRATYECGASLLVFDEPNSGRQCAPPDRIVRHSHECRPETWHFANECKADATVRSVSIRQR
jgi:hypothetical protein